MSAENKGLVERRFPNLFFYINFGYSCTLVRQLIYSGFEKFPIILIKCSHFLMERDYVIMSDLYEQEGPAQMTCLLILLRLYPVQLLSNRVRNFFKLNIINDNSRE